MLRMLNGACLLAYRFPLHLEHTFSNAPSRQGDDRQNLWTGNARPDMVIKSRAYAILLVPQPNQDGEFSEFLSSIPPPSYGVILESCSSRTGKRSQSFPTSVRSPAWPQSWGN